MGKMLDATWVELVLACLVAGCAFVVLPGSIFVPSLLVPALALYAVALLRRWSAAGRLGAFLVLLAVVGVAPTLLMMDAYHGTWSPGQAHDGGVIVTGRAVEALLAGHNPYAVSYPDGLRTGVLLVAGLVGLAWALCRDRPVAGALALGAALATKLLLAPFGLVFLAFVAARARQGRLDRSTALRAAGALVLPAAVTAAPFLLWAAGAMVQDMLLFHAGLAPPRYPIGGAGFPALLFDAGVIPARDAAAPVWSTLLPTVATLSAACLWVWRRTGVADLFAAGAAASLAALYFSRAFTMTSWWLPVALLSLAAVTPGPHPRTSAPAR